MIFKIISNFLGVNFLLTYMVVKKTKLRGEGGKQRDAYVNDEDSQKCGECGDYHGGWY